MTVIKKENVPDSLITFTKEQIQNISGLGDILRQIRTRLKKEGVSIEEVRKKVLVGLGEHAYLYEKNNKRKTI